MRKSLLAAVPAVVFAAVMLIQSPTTTAQSTDPTTWPTIELADIEYLGAFRLPSGTFNGSDFHVGGQVLAFRAPNTLYISNYYRQLAQVTIPSTLSSSLSTMATASVLQGFSDPTEGHWADLGTTEVSFGGALVHNDELIGTGYIFYDANNIQTASHFTRSLLLDAPSFSGFKTVANPANKPGYVGGYLAAVPEAWQQLLGGPAVTGQCCISIVDRTSWGPSAFGFDPDNIGVTTPVPTSTLLYYDGDHHTLGINAASNDTYGGTTQIGGLALIEGTRTALYFGRNGTGPYCYGTGTANQSLDGQPDPEGGHYCYDPTTNAKGHHAFPYNYQIWAYDLKELARVKAGEIAPWTVTPYGKWPISFPTPETQVLPGGVAYDPATRRIYVSQPNADHQGCCYYGPVIHVFEVSTAPPSGGGGVVTSVAIQADHTAPQTGGTTINFSATPTGGATPLQYKWRVWDGGGWTDPTGWTNSSSFAWTPIFANSAYQVGVWVRSNGNTTDSPEASDSEPFAITGSGPATGVSLASSHASPQPTNTSITWNATPQGGVSPLQYKWLVYEGNGWTPATAWTTSSSFIWTPAAANANYQVGVWVRSAGVTADAPEASNAAPFVIQ